MLYIIMGVACLKCNARHRWDVVNAFMQKRGALTNSVASHQSLRYLSRLKHILARGGQY